MESSGALGLGVGALLYNRHVSWHTTETLHCVRVCARARGAVPIEYFQSDSTLIEIPLLRLLQLRQRVSIIAGLRLLLRRERRCA